MKNELLEMLRRGCVIPAHPLALDDNRKLSEKHQRGLTRYYCDAGADGVAVGVHSTQFEIRDPEFGLYQPVLSLAAETVDVWSQEAGRRILKIAGVAGQTPQALKEAATAQALGYDACLLALRDLREETLETVLEHCRQVAEVMPVIGFYLQPAVGGRLLPVEFWREFAAIENVIAIKIAPFNRYRTFDVVRAVCEAGRQDNIALYTGNDDSIIFDLISEYRVVINNCTQKAGMVGGLLGHWAVWTRKAVLQFERIRKLRESKEGIPPDVLTMAHEVTDANAAFFDARNNFAGCLSGINEVLRRRGQVPSRVCLSHSETLSPGQAEEIDRVQRSYPHLNDDDFVAENLDKWLS